MVDLLRVEANERVDLTDMQYALNEVMQNALRDIGRGFLSNPVGTVKTWILSGFAMSHNGAKQLTVTKGAALLGYRISGATNFGMLTIDGDVSKTVDMTALTPAVYNVYVRFEYIDTTSTSRVFWDPAGDGQEITQTVPTRLQANWSMRVETSSPGAEWTLVGTADNTPSPLTLVDKRKLYFEGAVDASYASGWSTDGGGSANDRSASRAAYGVTDLQTFTAAMRQCLEDIKGRGLRSWYSRDIGGMNIGFDAAPVEDQIAIRDASFALRGHATLPDIVFDHLGGNEDRVRYDRVNNKFIFTIGNVDLLTLDATGIIGLNGISAGSGAAVEAVANTGPALKVTPGATTISAERIGTQSAPSGAGLVGDRYTDANGIVRTCRVAATPGTFKAVGALQTRQVLTAASGTYHTPAGCVAINVRAYGGGGAGGNAALAGGPASACGGGGASGGRSEKLILAPAASYAYTCGAAGGDPGGDTTFGSSLVTAKGGGKGLDGSTSASGIQFQPGGYHANSAGLGDVVALGAAGGSSVAFYGSQNISGAGASSEVGAGGWAATMPINPVVGDSHDGYAATGYASGGGGAVAALAGAGSVSKTGAAGTAGLVIVDEYF